VRENINMAAAMLNRQYESAISGAFCPADNFAAVRHPHKSPLSGVNAMLDASGNFRHGTPYNIPGSASIDGIAGNALQFDGIDDRVEIPYTTPDNLQFTDKMTLSGWIKREDIPNEWGHIVPRQFGTGGADSWFLAVRNYNSKQYPVVGASRAVYNENIAVLPNQWYHIAAVKNGTTASIYVNGVLVHSVTNASAACQTDNNEVSIGAQDNGNPGWAEWFKGTIDEVWASGTNRSSQWIKALYENQRPDNVQAGGSIAKLRMGGGELNNVTDQVAYVDGSVVYEYNTELQQLALAYENFGEGRIDYRSDVPAQGNVFYYMRDHLGSTGVVVDAQGQPLEKTAYYSYGTMVPILEAGGGEKPAREKFTTKEFDEEGGDENQPGISLY
jgi:hypothetical protein